MTIVLDASMTIAWLFENELTQGAEAALAQVAAQGAIVPSLWRLEIANVLRNAVRRRRCDKAYADASLLRLGRLAIRIDQETDARAWGSTRVLSHEEDLTPYDAAYLELALRLKKPLASADHDLIEAARRHGLEVLTP